MHSHHAVRLGVAVPGGNPVGQSLRVRKEGVRADHAHRPLLRPQYLETSSTSNSWKCLCAHSGQQQAFLACLLVYHPCESKWSALCSLEICTKAHFRDARVLRDALFAQLNESFFSLPFLNDFYVYLIIAATPRCNRNSKYRCFLLFG